MVLAFDGYPTLIHRPDRVRDEGVAVGKRQAHEVARQQEVYDLAPPSGSSL